MSKFCVKCGTRMDDNAMVCPECRMQQARYVSPQQIQSENDKQTGGRNGKSIASLVISIIGLLIWCWAFDWWLLAVENGPFINEVLAVWLPSLDIPIAVVGLSFGIQGMKSGVKTTTLVGIILNSLCLIFCVFNTLILVSVSWVTLYGEQICDFLINVGIIIPQ